MSNQSRRLISLICLLAYLVASAPGYVTSVFSLACDSGCYACADAGAADCGSAHCCSVKNQAEQERLATDECKCVRGAARPSSTVLATSSGNQKEQPGCPSNSTCPDGCYLCNAAGSAPLPFTPVPVLEGLKYLGAVNTGTFFSLCQPHPDELIRPPMC